MFPVDTNSNASTAQLTVLHAKEKQQIAQQKEDADVTTISTTTPMSVFLESVMMGFMRIILLASVRLAKVDVNSASAQEGISAPNATLIVQRIQHTTKRLQSTAVWQIVLSASIR